MTSPAMTAEIEAQLVQAKIAELTKGGIDFGDAAMVADAALLADGANVGGAMTMVSDPASRDKVTLYSRLTGMPSRVMVNMLAKKLAPNPKTGVADWTARPEIAYVTGTTLCLLHQDHPLRAELDGIGLAGKVCTKHNISSEYEARMHMLKKHKQEFAVIEEARLKRERDEDRAFQRSQMEAFAAMRSPTAAAVVAAKPSRGATAPCVTCGKEISTHHLAQLNHQKKHQE